MATKEATQDPDVGLEDRDIYVDIKVCPFKDEANDSLEFSLVAHDSQSVQGINEC